MNRCAWMAGLLVGALALGGCAAQLGNGKRTVRVLDVKAQAAQAYAAGNRSAALSAYERYVRSAPGDALAWTRIGNLHLMANEAEPAIRAYKKALQLEPGDVEAMHNLALIRLRQAHATMLAEYNALAPTSPRAQALACRVAWLAVLEHEGDGKLPECKP
jgi:cytochrome c-type biogenesis protein CcmH/NrfG